MDLAPESALALRNLGDALAAMGKHAEAAVHYRRALVFAPDAAEAHHGLGRALINLKSFVAAARHLERTIALRPENAAAHVELTEILSEQGLHTEVQAALAKAHAAEPADPRILSKMLFRRQFDPTATPEALGLAHRAVEQFFAQHDAAHQNDRNPERRLRIGYVSSDLGRHSVGFFFMPVAAAHDPAAFEILCYSSRAKEDDMSALIKSHVERWVSVRGMADEALAARVRSDRIDILVDLAGHTKNHRLGVFARRPAPVQVSWLGYPDSTGLSAIQYRLTDTITDPPGLADTLSSEKLVRLPHGFHCFEADAGAPEVSDLPAAAAGFLTFGCFNVLAKINDDVISVWALILNALPSARLWLKNKALSDPEMQAHTRKRFQERGVAPDRLDLSGMTATTALHLACYNRIDIALDTFPYNGTTTTCEALWMGVPVVALAGDRHAGRVGASLLTRLGLAKLVARDRAGYVATALELAADNAALAELRRGLRLRMAASPLCDRDRFCRDLEAAYRTMWRDWCNGSS